MKKITAARLTPLAGVGLAVVSAGSLLLFSLFAQSASNGLYEAARGAAPSSSLGGATPITLPPLAEATSPQSPASIPSGPGIDTTGLPGGELIVTSPESSPSSQPDTTPGSAGSTLPGGGAPTGREVTGGSGDRGGREFAGASSGGSVGGSGGGSDDDGAGNGKSKDKGKGKDKYDGGDKSKGAGKAHGAGKSKDKSKGAGKSHGNGKSKDKSKSNDKANGRSHHGRHNDNDNDDGDDDSNDGSRGRDSND